MSIFVFALLSSFIVLSLESINPYNVDLIIDEFFEANAVAQYALSITYSSKKQQTASTDTTDYFAIHQCDSARGNLAYVQLSIIAPNNPTFDIDKGYVVIELSNTKDKWNKDTIFAVNYIYNDINDDLDNVFTSISWEYVKQPQDVYARYRSYGSEVPITFLVSYTDKPNANIGVYDEYMIPGEISVGDYEELMQYMRSNQVYHVNNEDRVVFNFSVCTREAIDPTKWDKYTLNVIVVSDLSSPLSAFDLVACPVSSYPDPNKCTFTNIGKYIVKDQRASPLVNVQISHNDEVDLSQGTYITVYGFGGNADLSNSFLIEVSIITS